MAKCLATAALLAVTFGEASTTQASGVDPLVGITDAATRTRIQTALDNANRGYPVWRATASGRHRPDRRKAITRITARELDVALRFIVFGSSRGVQHGLIAIEGQNVPLGRIEDVVDWVTLAIAEDRLQESERRLGSSHATQLAAARREMDAAIRLRGATLVELRDFARLLASRRTDFDKVFDLVLLPATTPVPAGDIVVVPHTSGGHR